MSQLSVNPEFIFPFPRVTFGYFFNHPFIAPNQTLNQSALVNMAISRISTDKITVQPQVAAGKYTLLECRYWRFFFLREISQGLEDPAYIELYDLKQLLLVLTSLLFEMALYTFLI